MKKQTLAWLLVMAISFSLVACSKAPADTQTTEPTATEVATEATMAPTVAPTTEPTTEPTTAPTEPRKELGPLLELRGELPALQSREEMLEILQREVYGYMPAAPTDATFTVKKNVDDNFCAGHAYLHEVTMTCTVNGSEFSFPFRLALPKGSEKVPFFVYIGFTRSTSKYLPTEELIDNGYAVLYFNYEEVASDDSKLDNGLAAALYPEGKRGDTDPGKIAMWAWAASRVLDYAETNERLDMSRAAVCGHSRTGKAALLAGATDTRFQFTYSNNSGTSGAAITRRTAGETLQRITSLFPYWFCKNYKNWVARESEMPFDQHYLLACIAPRKVLVGSASKDANADPLSEQLACLAASPAFENGFVCNVVAVAGEEFFEGDIGYHLRDGTHYFSRTDWLKLIKFIDYHTTKAE